MKIYVVHLLWCAVISVGVEAQAQNVFPQTGNVGIGTTTPRARLQVSGGGSITLKLALERMFLTLTTLTNMKRLVCPRPTSTCGSSLRIRYSFTPVVRSG